MVLNAELSTADSTTLSEALVSDVTSTEDFVGLYRNSNEEICRYFDDLVNNDYHYHQIISNSEEISLDDDSNYENIPSLLDSVEDIVNNPQKYIQGGSQWFKIPSDAIFTQDAKLGNALGADRLWRFFKGSNHVKQYDERIIPSGWKQSGSNPLTGFARWIVDPFGKPTGIVVSKICGNGRHYMKKRVHGGQVVDILMMIEFHPLMTNMDCENYQKQETQSFVQDQQHQNPHDQSTKFIAGVKSGDKQWVELRDLLQRYDVDFDDVVRKTTGSTPSWTLGSFEGFSYGKAGKPGREIRQFGEANFRWALDTIKEIQFTRSEIKVEEFKPGKGLNKIPSNEIPNSALRVLIRGFYHLTEGFTDSDYSGQQIQPFCSKEDLKEILVWRYTRVKRRGDRLENGLAELNQKDLVKDFYYFGISTFLTDVLDDQQGERNNRVKSKNPAIRRYLDQVEPLLRDGARSIVDNRS